MELRDAWPARVTATEEHPPNFQLATDRLSPLGVRVASVRLTEIDQCGRRGGTVVRPLRWVRLAGTRGLTDAIVGPSQVAPSSPIDRSPCRGGGCRATLRSTHVPVAGNFGRSPVYMFHPKVPQSGESRSVEALSVHASLNWPADSTQRRPLELRTILLRTGVRKRRRQVLVGCGRVIERS